MLKVSVFDNVKSVEPLALTMEWGELSLLLSTHDFTLPDREAAPLFCPGEFDGMRSKKNVQRVHFGVVDFDDTDPDALADILERLKAAGQAFVFYTTWRHHEAIDKGLARGRLVFPFTRPVDAWEWPAVWSRMHVAFDGYGDAQCKDASRIYFFPSAPEGSEDLAVVDRNEGLPWDVDQARTAKEVEPKRTKRVTVSDLQGLLKSLKGSRTPYKLWFREKLYALISGESLASPGERDDTMWRLACAILDHYPYADPALLAAHFAPSIQEMEIEAVDCMTVANIEDKIRRKQQEIAEDELASDVDTDEERRRNIRAAFDLSDREHPYTADELQAFAADAKVALRDFKSFWIIQSGVSYYVFVAGRYRGPFSPVEVEMAAKTYLAPAMSAGVELYFSSARTGGEVVPKDIKRLMRDYGALATNVYIDMSAQRSYYDVPRRVIVEAPCPLRVHEAEFSSEVATWLRLLGGEQADKLVDWLAVATRVEEPCAALYLEGLKDVGKSLFAEGVARLWSDRGSIALADAMSAFNSSIIECPLIFADEAVPKDFRGHTRTGELRQFIQARTRSLRRKYLADATIKGCVRLILAANNADLISTTEQLTVNDIEAIVDRVVHVDANHAHEARDYLRTLGRERVARFIQGEEIAKHSLWLRDNHTPAVSHRFLVSGDKTRLHRRLTTSSGLRSAVCNWLVCYLLNPRAMDLGGEMLVRVHGGKLLANVRALSGNNWKKYETNIDPPSTGNLSAAVSGLSTGEKKQPSDGHGQRTHYWTIDTANLVSWAEDNKFATEDELLEALKVDTKPKAKR